MDSKLQNIKNHVLAGEAALSGKQKEELSEKFAEILNPNNIGQLENASENFAEILENIYPANLVDFVIRDLTESQLFSFGKELLKINWQNRKRIIHGYLDLIRNSKFLVKIQSTDKWAELISGLIDASNFTFRELFEQRVRDYGSLPYLNIIRNNIADTYSWNKTDAIVKDYSASLIHLLNKLDVPDGKVAFLLENSIEMALLDFACLRTGIVNVMIPANSVAEHIDFILNQTEAAVVFVHNEKQLYKLNQVRNNLKKLKKIVLVEGKSADENIIAFSEFYNFSKKKGDSVTKEPQLKDLATIMYTSGTTGEPKGIMFSHKNLIYKRFCRALALPEIGDKDRFLSYLPLFHTFGRYLELMGSFFWGAQYAFMENPSVEAMLNNLNLIKPTIFISIPKKWIQLYEYIASKINVELDDEEVINNRVKEVTGGELRWGLSAAGFLPVEIFRFFQKYGIELMSGFGMTEATGGITMTPPGGYTDNSLGKALPGIEIKLADDGELLIRGDYVMMGYYKLDEQSTFIDGWFPTGDVMTMDDNGFIEIVDRKKEIYKNVKGETIAPQKIENFFRDIEAVKQVFLVGDHRAFNTVLIYPNYDSDAVNLNEFDDAHLQEYFSSVIVSINKFLAPFERILDFRLIDRPFSDEFGELTPKGTYKRRVIVENFKDLIEEMYNLSYVAIYSGELEVRIPNWFLREKGILSRDIEGENGKIVIPDLNLELEIFYLNNEKRLVVIGSYIYKLNAPYVDFQALLTTPSYWIGNQKLIEFATLSLITWARKKNDADKILFYGVHEYASLDNEQLENLNHAIQRQEYSLQSLNLAVYYLQSDLAEEEYPGCKLISEILKDKSLSVYYLAVIVLSRPKLIKSISKLKRLFLMLDDHFYDEQYEQVLIDYLKRNGKLIDKELAKELAFRRDIRDKIVHYEHIIEREFNSLVKFERLENTVFNSLFNLLEALGLRHPTLYAKIRRILTRYQNQRRYPELSELALKYRGVVRKNFRNWLGENQILAVDPETGDEYEWSDVIIAEDDILEEDKNKLVDLITRTPILREAIFLFSNGKLIRLNDILPGGIWLSKLREMQNKKIFRASIQTRYHGGFDVLISLIYKTPEEKIKEEINWLILAGTRSFINELVDDFGGYWKEYNAYSSHYMPGENVLKYLLRETKHLDKKVEQRLYYLFPFFVWNAAAAYFNFWKLTDFTLQLGNTSPDNFVVPPHDYQQGTKIVSLSRSSDYKNFIQLFYDFYEGFVKEAFERFPFLKRQSIWYYIFSGAINSLGVSSGMDLLVKLKNEIEEQDKLSVDWEIGKERLEEFLNKVKSGGYIPKQLYFAIKRYHRWLELNKEAEPDVRARMLVELYDTYNLELLEESYPAVRLRFFKETVFSNANEKLTEFLNELIKKYSSKKINYSSIQELISERGIINFVNAEEKFFLTRMSFPHLRPEDSAEFIDIKAQGKKSTNLVIQLEDVDGTNYSIRNPITPKEISKLHQLFLDANMLVHFRPEHDYLVAVSERGYIIGGLFFSRTDKDNVYMEKIVVSNAYRRKGVSEGLMNEFFNRMKTEGVKFITTGFLRPEYFYKFDFKIAPKYSGLVKEL